MPYHVAANHAQCPISRPFAVVKDADGQVMGCHPSQKAADDHMAALYANDPEATRAATEYGRHGHAIMHPSPLVRAKAARYVDDQLPDLPPAVGE